MIKGITQSGRYMMVSGGQAGSTYINNFSGAQGVGNMRFNTTNQSMEVFDGNNWQILQTNFASVGLTGEAESLLDWAKDKRAKEAEYERIAQDSPAVQIALEKLRKAESELELITILSKDHEKNAEAAS